MCFLNSHSVKYKPCTSDMEQTTNVLFSSTLVLSVIQKLVEISQTLAPLAKVLMHVKALACIISPAPFWVQVVWLRHKTRKNYGMDIISTFYKYFFVHFQQKCFRI